MRCLSALVVVATLSTSSAVLSGPAAGAGPAASDAGWALDTTFGADGFARLDNVSTSDTVVVPGHGAYTIVERSTGDQTMLNTALVRFTESGELDDDFGVGGFVNVDVGPVEHLRMELQETPNGPRLVVSEWAVFGTATFYRFRMDGRLDRTFGDRGVASIPLGREMYIRRLMITEQQAIVAAGECSAGIVRSYPCLLVLTPDGLADREFDKDGWKVWKDLGKNIPINALAVTPDGSRIYVGGVAKRPEGWMTAAFRPDGKLDRDFGDAGVSLAQPACRTPDGVIRLHMESSGNLLAIGYACGHTVLARITPDGELDPDYGDGGRFALGDGEDNMYPYDSALDPTTDTAYWMYGGDDHALHLTGVRADGSLDPTFGPSGELVVQLDPPATGFWDPDLDLDGEGRLSIKVWYPDDVGFRGMLLTRAVNAGSG